MLGIALGVAALIIVLSVMNGFQKDVAGRMLSVISHVEVFSPDGAALPDPQRTLNEVRANPEVIGAAPFIGAQGLLARGETIGHLAVSLSLSVKTVSTYRTRVMEKMSLASNSDLTYYALKNGLIQ